MSAGRFRFLGKVFPLEALQQWWDHNWRQAEKDIQNLETGATGGAVLLAGRSGGQAIISSTAVNAYLGLGVTPAYPLEVKATVAGDILVNLWNTSGTGYTGIQFKEEGGTASFFFGLDNNANNVRLNAINNFPLVILTQSTERLRIESGGTTKISNGDLSIETLGKGLKIKTGANARAGVGVMAAGVLVVANTSVTASTLIFAFSNAAGVVGILANTARVAGTSFTIMSSVAADAGNVAWLLVEPS